MPLACYARSSPAFTAAGKVELRVDILYRKHRSAVLARCRRILRDKDAADDAAQETFVRLQNHMPLVSDPDEALRWMQRVATNYCLNQIRNLRLRTMRDTSLAALATIARNDVADTLADQNVARWLLRKVPQNLRVVAWLHHVEGLQQQEVADQLGLSRRTVVNRVAEFQERALRLLGNGALGRLRTGSR